MQQLIEKQAVRDRHRLELLISRLDARSPLKRIGGGYGYVTDEKDKRIDSVKQLHTGDRIGVRLRDGGIEAVISSIARAKSGLSGTFPGEEAGDRKDSE